MKHALYLLLLFTAANTLRIFHQLEQTHFNLEITKAANIHNGEGFDYDGHLTGGRGSSNPNSPLHFLTAQHQQDDSYDTQQSESSSQQDSYSSDLVGQTSVFPTGNDTASGMDNYTASGINNYTASSAYVANTLNTSNTYNPNANTPNTLNTYNPNPNPANRVNKDDSFNWQSLGSKVMSNSGQIQKGLSVVSGLIKPNGNADSTSPQGAASSQTQPTKLNPQQTPYLNPQDYDLLTADYDELDLSNIDQLSAPDIELLDPSTITSLDQI